MVRTGISSKLTPLIFWECTRFNTLERLQCRFGRNHFTLQRAAVHLHLTHNRILNLGSGHRMAASTA